MDLRRVLELATVDMTESEIREYTRLVLWELVREEFKKENTHYLCLNKHDIQAIMEVAGEQVSESTSDDSDSVGDN